ncbi:MAG: hypothetical protein NVS1B9_00210 [Solirubrobacteraceae bacterium]
MIAVGLDLVSEFDLETLLQRVVSLAGELTGARYAAFGVLNEQRTELERFITIGIDADARKSIGELPRGHGVLGVLIDEPRALRLEDVAAHPRSFGFPAAHPPMRSFLGVPVTIRGRAWGNLYLTEKEHGNFTAGDEEAAVTLAAWAAIAIENARLYHQLEARRDELEQAQRVSRITAEIARAVGDETNLDVVLTLIVSRARGLLNAGAVLVLLPAGDDLLVAALDGDLEPSLLGTRHAISGTPSDWVRAPAQFDLGWIDPALSRDDAGVTLVPMLFRSQTLGVLAIVGGEPGDPLVPSDLRMTLAALAATAVCRGAFAAAQPRSIGA